MVQEIQAARQHVDKGLIEYLAGNRRRAMDQIARAEAILSGLKHALKSQVGKGRANGA
jgi:hypothetical protein